MLFIFIPILFFELSSTLIIKKHYLIKKSIIGDNEEIVNDKNLNNDKELKIGRHNRFFQADEGILVHDLHRRTIWKFAINTIKNNKII